MIDFLKHTARGFVFSAALPPSTCAALLAAIQVIEEEPQWLIRLHENANLMRKGLAQLGYNIGNSESAVIPVIVGEDLTAYQLARALHAQGIYVSPVAYPAVRKGTSRVRVSVMATHSMTISCARSKPSKTLRRWSPCCLRSPPRLCLPPRPSPLKTTTANRKEQSSYSPLRLNRT